MSSTLIAEPSSAEQLPPPAHAEMHDTPATLPSHRLPPGGMQQSEQNEPAAVRAEADRLAAICVGMPAVLHLQNLASARVLLGKREEFRSGLLACFERYPVLPETIEHLSDDFLHAKAEELEGLTTYMTPPQAAQFFVESIRSAAGAAAREAYIDGLPFTD